MTGSAAMRGLRCVVIGGAGAVGGMFASLLLSSGAEVVIVDTRPRPPSAEAADGASFVPGDITRIDGALERALRAADLVLLAVPQDVAVAAFAGMVPMLQPDTLIVDTLSVKGRIVELARTTAAGHQVVSLNPLFAPQLGLAGRPVVAVVVHGGARARALLRLIGEWGGRVVELTADRHDRLAGAMQALTHAAVLAFGLALEDLGVDFAELRQLAPPPHATLLALLARILSGPPEVYWDVQRGNEWAAPARTALAAGMCRLAGCVTDGDEADFAALLEKLRAVIGPDLEHHRQICARTFELMAQT